MRLLRWFRDPVSGLTHLVGALAGAVGLAYLLSRDLPGGAAGRLSVLVYGLSLILLYAASATYHLMNVSKERQLQLRRLDHASIPVFIAGSYTPFCIIALHDGLGYGVLGVVWGLAIAGLLKSLYWIHSPRWVTAGVYVIMGWIVVIAIYPLSLALTTTSLTLLICGGVSYSVGALIYARKWPDPWPPHFGFHEIWHLFVLGGSACHYVAVLTLV